MNFVETHAFRLSGRQPTSPAEPDPGCALSSWGLGLPRLRTLQGAARAPRPLPLSLRLWWWLMDGAGDMLGGGSRAPVGMLGAPGDLERRVGGGRLCLGSGRPQERRRLYFSPSAAGCTLGPFHVVPPTVTMTPGV